MAYILDEVQVNNGQLIVAPADGLRSTAIDDNQDKKIKHSAYITGPVHVGDQAAHFSGPTATVMIARDANPLSPQSPQSVYAKVILESLVIMALKTVYLSPEDLQHIH